MKRPSIGKALVVLTLTSGAALSALSPVAYAQIQKTLRFIPDNVDFGVVREDDGRISRTVKAVNITSDSLFIISARTSCGCSAAEYSDAMIAPGDTTTVTLTYDPLNRPGKFLKTAKFFTGKERIGNSIKMCGTVIPSRRNLERSYPDKVGQLRLSSAILNAGEVSKSEARPMFVGLYNDSDRPLALTAETDSPPIEAALMPDTIEPYGVATLSVMLKGRVIPKEENEFLYKTYLINPENSDTLACIPVGGYLKQN